MKGQNKMYINSKIINPGDTNINLSTFKKIPNVYTKSVNRNAFFACLKKLIAKKEFHNNCCFLNITYKEKGKYKTENVASKCIPDCITQTVSSIVNEIGNIRVEVITAHGHTTRSDVFVILVND